MMVGAEFPNTLSIIQLLFHFPRKEPGNGQV
jgi:hypothetical protein